MKSSRLIYHISCLIYLSYLQNCINYSRLCIIMIHDLHLSSCRGTAAGQHLAASRTSSSAAGASRSRTPPSPQPGCTWSRVTCQCHVSRVCGSAVRSRLSRCSPATAAMITPTHLPPRRGQGHSPPGVDIV